MTYDKPRSSRRFDLQLPVTVRVLGDDTLAEKAKTRNVSSSGMFLEFDGDALPGTAVELVLELPPELTQCGVVSIACQGSVVRTERHSPSRTGIAISIDHYQFRRADK